MSKRQKKIFWPLLVAFALALTAVALATSRAVRSGIPKARTTTQSAVANSNSVTYVRVAQVWPQLRWHLKTLGDRMEKPGKERITIAGTIKRAGDAQALPMSLTLEFPHPLRLTVHNVIQHILAPFNVQAT